MSNKLDGKQTINNYETSLFKKITKGKDNYDYSATDILPNSRILCVGNTGSGKTNSLVSYLRLSPNLFSRIIIVYKEMEEIYEMLNVAFKGNIEFMDDLTQLPTLKKLRENMHEKERVLVVIDDWLLDIARNKKKYPQINDYFIRGRKVNCTLFFLAQDYYRVPLELRNQFTYVLYFNMVSKNDVRAILANFDNNKKQLRKLYKEIVKEPLTFMKINTVSNCPDNRKISRNFTDFIEDWSYDD